MSDASISVRNLDMRYGERVIQKDVSFTVNRGDIFAIMGGSGCGKSTLLRHMVGLIEPHAGDVLYGGTDIWKVTSQEQKKLMQRIGILYQRGALWSSLTLAENIELPLREYTDHDDAEIRRLAKFKLALVGLGGFDDYYPSELSGGMQKRAGLARAIALDPEFLFFDEPSAGLDPISSKRLDDLILALRDTLGATVVFVTHELPSIFAIATNSVFLDAEAKTMIASGPPKELLEQATESLEKKGAEPGARSGESDRIVREFLTRGGAS